MNASLPMYDRPELAESHEEYWRNIHVALSNRGIDSPIHLNKQGFGLPFWKSENLVLIQTCGMPYRKYLLDKVCLVGTPDFGVDGCPPGYYCSHFVVRKNDHRESVADYHGAVFAFNEVDSQSGFAAAWNHLKVDQIWFKQTLQTGAHLTSAKAVAFKEADIASIDAVTWRFAEQYEEFAGQLRILETTTPTPGLPYITSRQNDPDLIFDALQEALAVTNPQTLRRLHIRGIQKIPKAEYLNVPNPEISVSDHQ